MNSIKDLNWILNDYFRLRSEEIGKQELSHSISLSYGPEIERMYKQLEVRFWIVSKVKTILSDYSQYRKLIETQIHHINETYETTENPPSPIVEPESTPLPDQVDDNVFYKTSNQCIVYILNEFTTWSSWFTHGTISSSL